MRPTLQLTAIAVLAVSPLLAQQGTIRGKVTDSEFASPLPGANLHVVGTARGTVSDGKGNFEPSVSPGSHTLQVNYIGYQSARSAVAIAAADTVEVDFALVERTLMGDGVVVVGSRAVRTARETPAPVDVLSETEICQSGETETNQTLGQLAPSFNASHQPISDGTDHIYPASLRGLGLDQVKMLVLVKGKRRHSSALMHVNGTFGRGTVGVDLNAIPKVGVERIEILRDGAADQYGSDAIAGVINIVLKESTESLQLNSLMGTSGEGNGDQVKTRELRFST